MRPQMPLCKAGGERGPWVSLLEVRKSFHLRYCYSSPKQGKPIFGGLIYQELFLQVIFIPHFQEATQYYMGGPLF